MCYFYEHYTCKQKPRVADMEDELNNCWSKMNVFEFSEDDFFPCAIIEFDRI